MSRRINPPLKRDWKPGHMQIGLFIRTTEGNVIEVTQNNAWQEATQLAIELFAELCKGKA